MSAAHTWLAATRTRVAGLFLLVFALQALIAAGIQHYLVAPAFADVEHDLAVAEARRMHLLLEQELRVHASFCRDWSRWDDMVEFVRDPNPGFVASTLNADATSTTDIDAIAVYDRHAQVVFFSAFRAFQPHTGDIAALTAPVGAVHTKLFAQRAELRGQTGADGVYSGWWNWRGQPVLSAFCPILPTDGSGAPRGWLLLLRELGPARLQAVQDAAHLQFHVVPADADTAWQDAASLAAGEAQFLRVRELSSGYWQLRSLIATDNEHDLQLSGEYRSGIAGRGRGLLWFGWGVSMLVFAGLSALAVWRLDRQFILPLQRLAQRVTGSRVEAGEHVELPEEGASEIRNLARSFNGLIRQTEDHLQDVRRLSRTDALTSVANRRVFDETLQQECERAQRLGGAFALLMVDVDFFKAYNDHYGHQGGDDALRKLANCLQQTFARRLDLVARYGGEEFAVVLPGVDADAVQESCQRALLAVREMQLPHVASAIALHLTISIGATVMRHGDTPETLINRADQCLYRAKHEGRDRAVIS